MRMVTAKRVAGNSNTQWYHATGNWKIMLLVTDTLFIGNFPMVHQGDTFRTTLNKLFCGYKIIL